MLIHTSLVFIGPGYSKDLKAQPANNDQSLHTSGSMDHSTNRLILDQLALHPCGLRSGLFPTDPRSIA